MKNFQRYNLVFILLLIAGQTFAQSINSGKVIGRHIYGLAHDYQGDPVLINDRPLIYKESSFEQVLKVADKSFMISGFNDAIGSVYITRMDNSASKQLDTVDLNLASVDGFSQPTDASLTNWNSLLLTESGLIDAAKPDAFIDAFKPYYKGKANLINPYNYGWVSEVILLDSQGKAKAIKNYALGRMFAQQVIAMPDGKTIYTLDRSGNLYLFVADQVNSLAKGQLYAVSRQQDRIKYDLLGNSAALKVKFKLKKATFNSIFQTTVVKNKRCNKKYTYVNTIYGEECLKLNKKFKK